MSTPMSTDQESTLLSDGENEQISCCSTYASFGDKGVTATTNSHGHLLQITRYLDHEPSGFFRVDLTDILPSRSIAHRMQKLQDYSRDPNTGVGVRIEYSMDFDAYCEWPSEEVTYEEVPKLDFVHDRWPHFVTKTPEFDLKTQYIVSENTVYQIYALKLCQEEGHIAEIPPATINIKLFLRNLSVEADNDKNHSNSNNNDTQNTHYEEYSNHLSPDKGYIKRTCSIRNTANGNQDVIALFITPFINKRPQKFDVEPKSEDCRIILEGSVLKNFREGNELEVTLAYRLELISSGEAEFNRSVSPESLSESLSEAQAVLKKPFKKPILTQDDHFNINLRRNLEHILSVCSVPIRSDADGNNPLIALTCGDISGHRISTEASFYAFQFLLLALENMNNQSRGVYQSENDSTADDYAGNIKSRIIEVCQGHLKWLLESAESNSEVSSINGASSDAPIVEGVSNPNVLERSLISTSFQIIKAAEFCRAVMSNVSEATKLEIANGFRTIVRKWTAALDEKGKGRHFVFPNLREEREQWVFHLSDHAIIWWAAKSAEELELRVNESLGKYIRRDGMIYSKEIQKSLLKRFTIGNPSFEKHMIAISRSSNETRFQFRAKDTVLFYAIDLGLFDQDNLAGDGSSTWENKIEAWRCTVDYQKDCEDDQSAHLNWDQPLRYALALIMSSNNKQITSQAISQVQKDAKNILLQRSSSNGLFSGHPDENKRPTMFDGDGTSDLFWSATFEVPYIILKYPMPQMPIDIPGLSITATTPSPQGFRVPSSLLLTESTASDPTRESVRNKPTPMPPTEIPTSWQSPLMKHGVLSNNAIDLAKIVVIPDEWLYNEPRFFSFHTTLSEAIVGEFFMKAFKKHANEISGNTTAPWTARIKSLLTKERIKEISSKVDKDSPNGSRAGIHVMKVLYEAAMADGPLREGEPMGYIIDVPRVRRYRKKNEYRSWKILTSSDLLSHLNIKRTPTNAKKRIFHFSPATWNVALICCLASSEPEEVSSFFNRHALSNPYFFEETTKTLNRWVTELHLPFYQILSPQKSTHLIRSILEPETRRIIHEPEIIQFPPSDSKGTIKTLSRAVISFRFDGDLLDRYWTCHLIEYRPEQSDNPKDIFNITTQPVNGALKSNSWRQRRVLELVLFDRILREILSCTEEILTEAKGMLRASKVSENIDQSNRIAESDSKLPSISDRETNPHNAFCLSTQSLYKIQEVIQEVEDNLNEVFAKVELWKNRQNARGLDKPRWTLKDEYRYGAAVSKLRASNDTYAEELVRCRAKIQAFNSQLTRQIDASRFDRETRISEDARLFTIVFIPVTLATGVLSMGDIPSRSTIYYMLVLTAVIYLVNLTLFPNTKTIVKMLRYMVSQVSNCLLYLSGRSQHSIVEITRSFNEIVVEAGFSIVGFYLHCLFKMYGWANEHNVSVQQDTTTCVRSRSNSNLRALLYYTIYCFTFYAYLPLRKATEKLFPDATLHDPISSFSLDDDHPIQKAHVDFQEASNNAREDDEFGGLFNNLGQRNSGNLFTIWRKRLSEAGYIANIPSFRERRQRRRSSQLAS